LTGYRPTDSATLPLGGVDSSSEIDEQPRDLFASSRLVEVKGFRGRVFSPKCRWCGRRGYHLARCARAHQLRELSEPAVWWHYMLELAQRELANRGGSMR